jgi:DNA (cytosine-5)-methyltransferase 1
MPADAPLRTVCAQVKGGHFSVVAPTLAPLRGTSEGHLGGHSIEQPLSTVSAGGTHHALVSAHLTHLTHHGDRPGTSPADPLPTVTGAHRGEQAMALAFFEQANGGFYDGDGRAADAPMSTITSSGSNQRLATAYLVKYYSSGGQWQGLAEPMHTLPTKGRMGLVQTIQVPVDCLSPEHRSKASQCAALLHEHMPEHFPEPASLVLMSYGGTWWVLVDITLRMLKARELYRAQSFPNDYIIHEIPDPTLLFENGVQVPGDPRLIPRIPLSITAQIRMCGNSVSPAQAEALVRANFRHEAAFMDRIA